MMLRPTLNKTRLTRLGVVVWLVLLSVLLITLAAALSRMEQERRQGFPDEQIAELQVHIDRLETFRRDVQAAPSSVATSDFQQAREQWQQQWELLDQRLQSTARARDLEALRERLDTLAQQVRALKPSLPHPIPNTSKPRARPSTPGFQVLGVESRGGERFLAIQPNGTDALDQVRLLRIGESENSWQLTALEERNAVFTVGRKIRRLALPED